VDIQEEVLADPLSWYTYRTGRNPLPATKKVALLLLSKAAEHTTMDDNMMAPAGDDVQQDAPVEETETPAAEEPAA